MRFKVLLISIFILLSSISTGFCQAASEVDTSRYKALLPNYIKIQYAGGIGFMSAGVGYTFFKTRLDVSLFYGYVPEWFTVDDLHSISLQLTAKLLRFKINDNIEILPLNLGWYAHHTFGNEFWVVLPDHYSEHYYWWSPGRNAGVFIGGEIKTKLLANETPASGTAIYFRVGTRGLYLASKWGNTSIPITDILEFGFGIAIYR